jgi:GT2 family glycosyltransferase
MDSLPRDLTLAARGASRNGALVGVRDFLRVDGKFFARAKQRVRIQGVTYGPFAPNAAGQPFPSADRVADDFERMKAIGVNAIRTYHVPPEWFIRQVDEQGMALLVDVPWPKHLCFLSAEHLQRQTRTLVRQAAERCRNHPCLLAYNIGNEIPADIVRWHGVRRVESFLAELMDVAKQADPDGLVTYSNFPPTEYLDLSFLDFVTFNVYLHDIEAFRRYLFRLQNLVGDRPLVLGEIGVDTLRHGEAEQAEFLAGHVREAMLMGAAGTFVFSWTDDWYTGGYPIQDWAFGITRVDRFPKASYHALRDVFDCAPAALLGETPRVSVVVCSYNGGDTLDQCLRSLLALDYPDCEVIVVDDGSTDNTREILARFASDAAGRRFASETDGSRTVQIRAIHQENLGLSAARNVGLRAANGSIIAYTDADCFADPDWLAHLVYQLQRSSAAAVGGPNLTPQDGWLAACMAASPGQPMHVLESDQEAEHIPGCNMAFRREALEAINGFDFQYRKAGDDVDVCWRLQQAGFWITFAPGAFVWHHRRQNPRAYLRQQAGYGEAEALLRFKHPDKFNGRGHGKWRGVLYGASLQGLRLTGAIIYRGVFGTALFQCIYQPVPAHWAMLPCTLEWHLAMGLVALVAFFWPLAWIGVGTMLCLSVAVAALQAAQARLSPEHEGPQSRLLIFALCYLQPLVRSWLRYQTRLLAYSLPTADCGLAIGRGRRLPLSGSYTAAYWSEEGCERTELLGLVIAYLTEHRWGKTIDSGWSNWDVEIYCHPWTVVQVCTAQEEHGGGKRLIRVRFHLRLSSYTRVLAAASFLAAAMGLVFQSWVAAVVSGLFLAFCPAVWWRGSYRAAHATAVFDRLAGEIGLVPCDAAGPASEELPPERPWSPWARMASWLHGVSAPFHHNGKVATQVLSVKTSGTTVEASTLSTGDAVKSIRKD